MALEIKILDGVINLDFNTTHPSFQSLKQSNCYINTRRINRSQLKMVAFCWRLFSINRAYSSLYETYARFSGDLKKM